MRLVVPGLMLLGPLLAGPAPAQEAVDPLGDVRGLIVEALDRLDLGPAELGFDKKRVDPYTLPRVARSLDEPLGLPAFVAGRRAAARALAARPTTAGAFALAAGLGEQRVDAGLAEAVKQPRGLEALLDALAGTAATGGAPRTAEARHPGLRLVPEVLHPALERLLRAALAVKLACDAAHIDPATLGGLGALWTEGLPLGQARDEDGAKSLATALATDRAALRSAIGGALALVDEAVDLLRALPPEARGPRPAAPGADAEGLHGDVVAFVETPLGPIVIGGPGRAVLERDLFVLIDLGGDDEYRGRCGAASAALGRPFSVAIDLGGDDRYRSRAALDQGAAALGLGVLLDLGGGADRYEAGDCAQGAGILGFGLLVDDGGADRYEALGLAQGAGGFGHGLLLDLGGDDGFEAARYAQGFGGVQGFGLLLDRAGHDRYDAGRRYPHAPLLPEQFQSLSQGFGLGDRYKRASGGIGFLWDGAGNDVYICEVYGQGASYWMALGALVDDGGHDRYLCTQYGQGAGIHLSAGCLWDLAGDDSYTLHKGVGQGGAHDLAVGFLLDGGGDDYYQGAGLSQGGAGSNAVAMLVDGGGNDCYAGAYGDRKEPRFPDFQGSGKPARGYGSVGVLLDVAGVDLFSHRGEGEWWLHGDRGIAWDRVAPAGEAAGEAAADPGEPALPDPLPEPTEANLRKLFADAALWEVGSNRTTVRRARAVLRALGPEAWRWILTNQFDADITLKRRALRGSIPRDKVPLIRDELLAQLADVDPRRRVNALDFFLALGLDDAYERLARIVAEDGDASVRREAARLLGELGDARAVRQLVTLAGKDHDGDERRAAIGALGRIADASAVHALADLCEDPSFTIRGPARAALRRQQDLAIPIGVTELGHAEGPALRCWLALFADWKDPRCREPLESRVLDLPDPEARRRARAILDAIGAGKADEGGR
ncbi:MAG: HEAT repeat domain-containing protein [Planctomycetota bacterium]